MNTAITVGSKYVFTKLAASRNIARCAVGRKSLSNGNKGARGHETYCLQAVKKHDWEGYLCTLLLPRAARRSVFAVRAFNVEVAKVAGNASESVAANMRLVFWRDSLNNIFDGQPPESPVTMELHKAVVRHNLSKSWLKRMIQARDDKLVDMTFSTLRDVENYAEDTATAQLCLTLQCLGINDLHADHVASHIGRCQGIVTMIRAVPHHAVRRKIQLPTEFLIKHSVSQEEIFRGSNEQKVKNLIFDIAGQASLHLQHARNLTSKMPTQARKAFLPAVSLDWYLRQLQLADFDVFHPKLQERNHKLPISLLVQHVCRRV